MHVPSRTSVAVFRAGIRDRKTILTLALPAEADTLALEAFLGIFDPIFVGAVAWEETGIAGPECFRLCRPSSALLGFIQESEHDLLPYFEHPADAQLTVAITELPRLTLGAMAGEHLPTVPSPALAEEDSAQLPLPSFAPS